MTTRALPEIEVIIVDDHPAVRRGLELLLPRVGLRVIGTAETAAEADRMIAARRPQVAIVDIGLADESGSLLAARLAANAVPTRTVLYTGHCGPQELLDAVSCGAHGIVLKTSPLEALATAVRAAAGGGHYFDRRVSEMLPDDGPGVRTITAREAEMLALIADGLTVEDVAERLVIAESTVHTHVRNAVRKLGARGRLHAVVLALRNGDLELAGLEPTPRVVGNGPYARLPLSTA